MPLAAPLILPFAELAGITIAGLGMAAASKKVSDFISDNPEISTQILTTLVPGGQGLNALFKDKDAPSTKDIVLGELGKEKGNYSDPDAEGAYSSKRGRIIKALEEAGKIKKGPDKDYDSSKKYKGYKKFYEKADGGRIGFDVGGSVIGKVANFFFDEEGNASEALQRAKFEISKFISGMGTDLETGAEWYNKLKPEEQREIIEEKMKYREEGELGGVPVYDEKYAGKFGIGGNYADGGAIGIEVLFEEKKDGGRIGFANGGDNIIGADLKDERPFYQQVVEDRIIDVIPADIATAHGKAMYTPQGIANTSNSIRDYHIAANADLSNRLSNKIGENYGNIAQTAYNVAAPALSIPASLGYDFSQAQSRMEPGSGIKGLAKAFMDEAPFSAAYQRAIGAAAPLAEQSSNVLNKISNFFFAPAGAADFQDGEMLQAPTRTNVQGMDLEMDPGARINPNIQPQQNIFQRAGDVFSSIKDNIPNFGIMGLLSNLDRFDTLSPEDQAFILDQAGGNRPSKDPFGINRRSAFGNYAQYVRDKGIFAPGKRGEYYRSISGLDQALMDTLDREQKAKAAYEKQIRDAADAASRNAARARSITAGYGGSDDSRGATGPTASGAGMGVGGGYASDYGFAKGGLATMFVEKR